MNAPEIARLISDYYVLVTLAVNESEEKKALENPGSQKLLAEMGGERAGLPFYVFLNKTGMKIADSMAMPNGGNIGYPASSEEIEAFEGLLERTAPGMASSQRAQVVDYLVRMSASSPPPRFARIIHGIMLPKVIFSLVIVAGALFLIAFSTRLLKRKVQ